MSDEGDNRRKGKWEVKVYLVCQMQNLAPAGAPNIEIIDAKLTRAAAEEVRRRVPGTYIVRKFASK